MAASAAVVSLGVLSPVGKADEPLAQGWWSDLTVSGGDAFGASSPGPPDVPEGGLLIQGGVNGPSAYAALRYLVPTGARIGPLVLEIASDSGTVASSSVMACVLTSTFTPAHGGPMADAPSYDCEASVIGESDGATFEFDVGSLGGPGGLAIALVPGGPGDRVVFSQPGAASLPVTPPPSPATSEPSRLGEEPPPISDSPGEEFAAPPFEVSPPHFDTSPPEVRGTDVPAVRPADRTFAPPVAAVSVDGPVDHDDGGAPLFMLGIGAAAAFWLGAGRVFGGGPVEAIADE